MCIRDSLRGSYEYDDEGTPATITPLIREGILVGRLHSKETASKMSEKPTGNARAISYLRVSLTDRCDFRCVYCMSEKMTFMAKSDLLSLEEIARVIRIFNGLGVEKVRITGGEPLVRKNIDWLFQTINKENNLKELSNKQKSSLCESRRTKFIKMTHNKLI